MKNREPLVVLCFGLTALIVVLLILLAVSLKEPVNKFGQTMKEANEIVNWENGVYCPPMKKDLCGCDK
jgi:hypothetical protein